MTKIPCHGLYTVKNIMSRALARHTQKDKQNIEALVIHFISLFNELKHTWTVGCAIL